MRDFPPTFTELVERQGWNKLRSEDRNGYGFVASIEKDGLRFEKSADPSGVWCSVSNGNGYADAAELVEHFGGRPAGNDKDFFWLAERRTELNAWIGSDQHRDLIKRRRAAGMDKLRAFQRSIGMKESWLAGEEDQKQVLAGWARTLRSPSGLKYWLAAFIALLYLGYKVIFADDRAQTATGLAAAFVAVLTYLILMRFRKSSGAHTGIEK